MKWSTPLDLERHKKEFALRNRFWSACYKKKTTRAATIAARNICSADTKVLFMRISLAKKSNLIINKTDLATKTDRYINEYRPLDETMSG